MMKTYLGENLDTSEAIEFLCLVEGGEVTHYEVLSTICQNFDNIELSSAFSSYSKRRTRTFKKMFSSGKAGSVFYKYIAIVYGNNLIFIFCIL